MSRSRRRHKIARSKEDDGKEIRVKIVPVGGPVAALLKASFLRDFMLNIDYVTEYAEGYNLTPSDAVDDLFTMMRADGYEIHRDGDTVVFRDADTDTVITDAEAALEVNIKRSASVQVTRAGAISMANQIISEVNDDDDDRDQPPTGVEIMDGEPVLPIE